MIHYATKNIMQHTNKVLKYYTYCGVHVFVDSERWTDNYVNVTCKKCISQKNKYAKKIYR